MSEIAMLEAAEDSPQGEIDRLREENTQRIQQLMARQLAPNGLQVLDMRMEMLIEFAVPTAVRQLFDLAWEQRMASFLDAFEESANRKILLAGVTE